MRIRFLQLFQLVAKQSIAPGHRRRHAGCAVPGLVFFVLSGCSGGSTSSGQGGTGGSATGGSATGGAAGGSTGSGGTAGGGAGGSAGRPGMGGSASGTVDLCRGLPTGTGPIPYSKLAQPAVGVATKDPDFGTTIVRVTDITAQLGAGTNTATPVYPPVATWNIDESYMLFYVRGGSCGADMPSTTATATPPRASRATPSSSASPAGTRSASRASGRTAPRVTPRSSAGIPATRTCSGGLTTASASCATT